MDTIYMMTVLEEISFKIKLLFLINFKLLSLPKVLLIPLPSSPFFIPRGPYLVLAPPPCWFQSVLTCFFFQVGEALNDYPCPGPAMDLWINRTDVRKALTVPTNSYFFNGDNGPYPTSEPSHFHHPSPTSHGLSYCPPYLLALANNLGIWFVAVFSPTYVPLPRLIPDFFWFLGVGFNYTLTEKNLLPFYLHVIQYTSLRVLVYNGDTDPGINSFITQDIYFEYLAQKGVRQTQKYTFLPISPFS